MRCSNSPSATRCAAGGVAILDAHSPPGLAFTRSLGRRGIPIHVYSPNGLCCARLSRYCTRFSRCPPPEDADLFLPWLRAEVAKYRFDLIAPTSDLMALYMAEFPECFPDRIQAAMPAPADTQAVLFKDRFNATCTAHNIRAPWTLFPQSIADALDQAANLPYPVILKPRAHVGVDSHRRGAVVHNPSELRRFYAPYAVPPHRTCIMERYPQLRWPLLQEYIPDALKNLFSVSGLLAPDGTVLAYAGSRKTLQWPPTLGVGIRFEPWTQHPETIALGLEFVRQSQKRGIFELEFVYDARIKDFVAIDLNPRAHGHITFDIARNNDLPYWWYCQAMQQPLPEHAPTHDDVRWLHAVPYHVGHLVRMVQGPSRKLSWNSYVEGLRGPTVDIVNDVRDPLPSLAHVAYMLRHPGGLVRPFLRAATPAAPSGDNT